MPVVLAVQHCDAAVPATKEHQAGQRRDVHLSPALQWTRQQPVLPTSPGPLLEKLTDMDATRDYSHPMLHTGLYICLKCRIWQQEVRVHLSIPVGICCPVF